MKLVALLIVLLLFTVNSEMLFGFPDFTPHHSAAPVANDTIPPIPMSLLLPKEPAVVVTNTQPDKPNPERSDRPVKPDNSNTDAPKQVFTDQTSQIDSISKATKQEKPAVKVPPKEPPKAPPT